MAIAQADSGYYIGYRSIFDSKDVELMRYPDGHYLLDKYKGNEDLETIFGITKGFYTVQRTETGLILNDMRFGQIATAPDPNAPFVFTYLLSEDSTGALVIDRGQPDLGNVGESLDAIWQRLQGNWSIFVPMQRKIIVTSDGSHSIFIPEMEEHYHSTHGAIQESRHIFINTGLQPKLQSKK